MAESRPKRERDVVDTNALRSFHEVPSESQKPRAEEEKGKRWAPEQDDALRKAVEEYGQRNWKAIASRVDGRNHAQCLQRWNKVLKPGLVKGHWSFEEDSTLEQMVMQGCHSWGEVAAHIPGRTAKQCRERWRNHLDPSINKSPFTAEEDSIIQNGFEKMGNRWTQIAELLPGRTEDAVKVRWKALNPDQKVKAKPGRPKLMPVYGDGYLAPMPPYSDNSALVSPMPISCLQSSYTITPHGEEFVRTAHVPVPHQYPEPIIEPLSDEAKAENEMHDAMMLKELLRSHSNSLLSFGSIRDLSSYTDMSPDELLASGELDEMLCATMSISKEKNERDQVFGTSSMMESLTSSFKNPESLQKAVQNLDHDDKHLFQGLIDSWRAQQSTNGGTATEVDDHISNVPVDPNVYLQHNFKTSSGCNMTHSSDYEQTRSLSRRNSNGILHELGNISNDIGDLLGSDLMRPIRKGKMY
ncbi:unnamed protein product [Peronospora belbahrii]|uniref:Uncharacterized protein n=1 Tax=Peronospora belbahrii TaxID=622444 RepID=A0AAU9L4T4_9STRA|nr:unnamed protein product [Peronospora belbahrii]